MSSAGSEAAGNRVLRLIGAKAKVWTARSARFAARNSFLLGVSWVRPLVVGGPCEAPVEISGATHFRLRECALPDSIHDQDDDVHRLELDHHGDSTLPRGAFTPL